MSSWVTLPLNVSEELLKTFRPRPWPQQMGQQNAPASPGKDASFLKRRPRDIQAAQVSSRFIKSSRAGVFFLTFQRPQVRHLSQNLHGGHPT